MNPLLLGGAVLAGLFLAKEVLGKERVVSSRSPGGRSNFVPTQPRDLNLLEMIDAGQYVLPDFTAVQAVKDGHLVEVYAANDALRVGMASTSAPRAMVSHEVAQEVADRFGLMLPTSRMSDMAYLAADPSMRVGPITRPADSHMADQAVSDSASQQLDQAILSRGLSLGSFSRVCGKEWIASERLLEPLGTPPAGCAVTAEGWAVANVRGDGGVRLANTIAGCNFGWQSPQATSKSPGGVPCIQSPGLRHDLRHYDYSQWLTLYQYTGLIDGEAWHIPDALTNPDVAYLFSDEVPKGKACRVTRHPAMPLTFG